MYEQRGNNQSLPAASIAGLFVDTRIARSFEHG